MRRLLTEIDHVKTVAPAPRGGNVRRTPNADLLHNTRTPDEWEQKTRRPAHSAPELGGCVPVRSTIFDLTHPMPSRKRRHRFLDPPCRDPLSNGEAPSFPVTPDRLDVLGAHARCRSEELGNLRVVACQVEPPLGLRDPSHVLVTMVTIRDKNPTPRMTRRQAGMPV